MSTILGRPITMGGGGKLPDIFGDGSDGDLVIKAGETVTLEVPVPHQSVVEKNYKSITIEAGGTLTTSDPNAGLVLRCQGDCTVHGTIDQSGKAPKTNPDTTYQYPEELSCGDGGTGGHGGADGTTASPVAPGGTPMEKRPYGGGYGSGGGGGGLGTWTDGKGAAGGSTNEINTTTPDSEMFIGGVRSTSSAAATPGENGGGGGGGKNRYGEYNGGTGGSGAGANGTDGTGRYPGGGGGGAGNVGGGVVLLYVGGNLFLDGAIDCSGKDGGNGGGIAVADGTACGGGGGGGGGGSVYVLHRGTQTVTGSLNVNGGAGGQTNTDQDITYPAAAGTAGGVGTSTVKQYVEEM